MSAEAQTIPEDIMQAAQKAFDDAMVLTNQEDGDRVIALAILAERERCIAEMDNFISNVTVSIDGRSRFDIYDLNRECKKSVRYVRDRLTGMFDKYWSEEPLGAATKAEA